MITTTRSVIDCRCGGAIDFATGICDGCQKVFSKKAGVLSFAQPTDAHGALATETVTQFGESWRLHGHQADYHEEQFLSWIAPAGPADFLNQIVLEAGCGKGRHSRLLGRWQAKEVWAVDLSPAVYQAANACADLANVHCLQADLLHLPIKSESIDRVVCVGVLHHLANPAAGLAELWRVLKPGGKLVLWVYAREGNGWIVHLVDPVRKNVTSKIPTRWLRPMAWPISAFLFVILRLFYRWPALAHWLPYHRYLEKIAPFPFREIEHIVLDHLCPPIAHYLPETQIREWFRSYSPADLSLRWHNGNSWNIVAEKPNH